MFQFTRFPPHSVCVREWVARHYSGGVAPFGNSRINASVQLPWTYRRLRVLRRQSVPRHSSHTLFSFNFQLYRVFDACFASILKKRYTTVKVLVAVHPDGLGLAARGNDTSASAQCQGLLGEFGQILRL